MVAFERTAVEAEAVLEAGAAAALDRDPEHVRLAGGLARLELAHLFGRALGQFDEGFDGCHDPIVPQGRDAAIPRVRDTRYRRG